jgi:microcystin-dependent protein
MDAIAPTGTIVAFAGIAVPPNWLLCDGAEIVRLDYPALFSTIGTSFGGGDGVTTFNLPDLRGRFMRGVDHGSGHDPDAASREASNPGGSVADAVGSMQSDSFQGHRHTYSDPGHTHDYCAWNIAGPHLATFGGFGFSCGPTSGSVTNITITDPANDGTSGAPRTSLETRPTNVNVNYIVRI